MSGDDDESVGGPVIEQLLVVVDAEQSPVGPAHDRMLSRRRAEGRGAKNVVDSSGAGVVVAPGREGTVHAVVVDRRPAAWGGAVCACVGLRSSAGAPGVDANVAAGCVVSGSSRAAR